MASKTAEIRAKLDDLGKRRAEHDAAEEEMVEETKAVLARVEEDPEISTTEAARRLGVHRTTLYRVYCK